MTVYIDVLIFDNMLLNSVILMSVAGYMKKSNRALFIILSAAIGTAYSVVMVLLPTGSFLNMWFFKMLLSLVMVFVAFYPKTLKEFLKLILCFYIVTFIFAGLAITLIFLWGQTPTSYNGVMYFSWSSPIKYLLVVAALGLWLVRVFLKTMQKRKMVEAQVVDLYISINGEGCCLPALIDTGNELKDPVTGAPAVIVELEKMKDILPETLVSAVENGGDSLWNNVGSVLMGTDLAGKFRLVPFRSLGCEHGMLPGIRSDYISVRESGDDEECRQENVIVCLYLQSLSPEKNYYALVGTDLNVKTIEEE